MVDACFSSHINLFDIVFCKCLQHLSTDVLVLIFYLCHQFAFLKYTIQGLDLKQKKHKKTHISDSYITAQSKKSNMDSHYSFIQLLLLKFKQLQKSTQIFNYMILQYLQYYYLHSATHPQFAMRRLLTKNTNKSFASLKEIVANKSQEILSYQKSKGIEFQKHLKQLILDRIQHQKRIRKINQNYSKMCLTAAKPVQSMLKQFLSHSKKYDQEDLVETAVHIAKAYQMGQADHEGHLDRWDYKLLQSPMFDHFIEQLKYSLSSRAYIQIPNIVRILESLKAINYVDIEVINLVIKNIERILNFDKQDQIKVEQRAHQFEKKGYYNSQIIGFDKDLLSSEFFQNNLAFFEQKKKKFAQKITFTNITKSDFQDEQNHKIITQLIQTFDKFNQSSQKLIQAIISIRQQYHKLVTISQNQKVMRNPELNNAALQIEQKLLSLHLITFEDIKNPQLIVDIKREYQKVQQVIKIIMSEASNDNFQDYLVTEEKDMGYLNVRRQREFANLGALFEALAKYASLPYKLNGTDNKITLLSVKWQRQLIGQNFKENNIETDRMFRKSFMYIQKFFDKNKASFDLQLIQASFPSKIRYFSSLLQLGFIEQFMQKMNNEKIIESQIISLPDHQFLCFLRLMSTYYQVGHKNVLPTKQIVYSRLEKMLNQQECLFGLDEICYSINYLYQVFDGEETQVYRKLVTMLSEEVNTAQFNKIVNKQTLIQARRILSLQNSQISTTSLSTLAQLQTRSANFNPYIDALYKSLHPRPSLTPYIPLGITKDSQIAGLYIADSGNSSINGNYVSGNTYAYCLRLRKKYNVHVLAMPITKFIDIQWKDESSGSDDQVIIKMKSSEQILSILDDKYGKEWFVIGGLLRQLAQKVSSFGPGLENKHVLERLKKIAALYSKQKQVILMDQFYAKRTQLLVQFSLLKRDFNLVPSQNKQQVNNLLLLIEKQLLVPLQKIQQRQKEFVSQPSSSISKLFKGKRITLDLIPDENQKNEDQNLSPQNLVSLPYILDTTYAEYSDWQKMIKQGCNYHELKLQNVTGMTKLLINKFCPRIKQTIVALPEPNAETYVPYFPLDWQSKYYYDSQKKEEKAALEKIAEEYRQVTKNSENRNKYLDTIITIQNFKHQLKISKSPNQIAQTILQLQFIDNLIQERLSSSPSPSTQHPQPQLLPRNPQSYLQSQLHKSQSSYLQSPYLRYMLSKHQKKEKLKQKLVERKNYKLDMENMLNKGEINRKMFVQRISAFDNNLIKEFKKELKKKGLSHAQHVQILDEGSKIVQLWGDLDQLTNKLQQDNEDTDLLVSNGNLEQMMRIKRVRAQNNLILCRILYLKSQGKPLKQSHTKYLQHWKQETEKSLQSLPKIGTYTKQIIKNISNQDKNRLNLTNINITNLIPKLALSDLILELHNFLQLSVVTRLENQVYAHKFAETWGIPRDMFGGSRGNDMTVLTGQMEEAIFDKASKLNQKQIECLIEMSKVFKTQGLSDRQKYRLHYSNLPDKLEQINNSRLRNPLCSQYLKQKDYEYYNNYFPTSTKQQKQKHVDQLWHKFFNRQKAHTKSNEIRDKVNELCRSMLFIKMNLPPFFSAFVLEILKHPSTDIYVKEKLIAYCELFKIQVMLDSNQIQDLIQEPGFEVDKIWDSMRKVARKGEVMSLL